jgi:hypothetical protein
MNKTKSGALLIAAITAIYLYLMTNQAVSLINLTSPIAKTMGFALFGLPVVGVWALVRELIFGAQTEALVKQVQAEDAWPLFDFELRPSGRPVRADAQRVFAQFATAAEAAPEDWHSWFNLSLAYDAAGDSRRARASMRKAISLKKAQSKKL